MCMEHTYLCKCGEKEVSITYKNELMPHETFSAIYCPKCSGDVQFDHETMVADNNWIIEYDMEVARFSGHKLPADHSGNLSPELLFDEDYCSWRGIYPGDHVDSIMEREKILELAKKDPKRYLEEIKNWGNNRMERLKQEGWRKAHDRVEV